MDIEKIIEQTASATADKVVRKLKDGGRLKRYASDACKKTEELLYLYPALPDGHHEKKAIKTAIDKIQADPYSPIIYMRYFKRQTLESISESLNCKYQTVSKNRNRLIRILAGELFPELVAEEIRKSP